MDTGNYKEIEEEVELTFRNQKFKIVHRCFINEETGEKFTTNKQDEDMMWTLFRAYWERKGFEHFYDIDGYREKQEPASEDLEKCVVEQMEVDGDVDDFVRRGIDDIALKYAALGAQWQKEQMMKGAVDGEVNIWGSHISLPKVLPSEFSKQRVKIIIIKE